MREKAIQDRIRVAVSKAGAVMFRNNVGQAILPDGSVVRYGLAVGSSDLIGWKPVEITPDMVGQTVAIFTAIEVKTKTGRPTPAQVHFIEAVKKSGGLAGVARSEDEAIEIIG